MRGLIIILAIFSIISSLNKKKQQEEAQKRKKAFENAFAEPAKELKKAAGSAIKSVEKDLPFTREDWSEFIEGAKAAERHTAPVTAGLSAENLPEGVSHHIRSTQGESEAEHHRHMQKIAADERRRLTEKQQAEDARSAKLRRLRQAVIMSEVLSKPVSLRNGKGR